MSSTIERHGDPVETIKAAHSRRFLVLCSIVIALNALILTLSIISIFAIDIGRAYVTGEGLYSKAQKSALIRLQQYVYTGDEDRYREFRQFLDVPKGDRLAREALTGDPPDLQAAKAGFLRGEIPDDDIAGLSWAFVYLKWWQPFRGAINDWRDADHLILELDLLGQRAFRTISLNHDHRQDGSFTKDIATIDHRLTFLEAAFSAKVHEIERFIRNLTIECLIAVSVAFMIAAILGIGRLSRKAESSEQQLFARNAELSAAKTAAETADKVKSAFLANTSHELRTPLNAVIGFSEIMKNQIFGPVNNERYLQYAGDIYNASSHLLRLINEVLDLSRIEAGKLELRDGIVSVSNLIEETVLFTKTRAEQAKVDLSVACSSPGIALCGDEVRLKQVLLNLVSNAIKFTPEFGRVRIASELAPDGSCLIAIQDSGIGMTEREIELALQPFGQVDHDLNRKYDGAGLGLPISKKLVELHGGSLKIDSHPGRGTTICIVVPSSRVRQLEIDRKVEAQSLNYARA